MNDPAPGVPGRDQSALLTGTCDYSPLWDVQVGESAGERLREDKELRRVAWNLPAAPWNGPSKEVAVRLFCKGPERVLAGTGAIVIVCELNARPNFLDFRVGDGGRPVFRYVSHPVTLKRERADKLDALVVVEVQKRTRVIDGFLQAGGEKG